MAGVAENPQALCHRRSSRAQPTVTGTEDEILYLSLELSPFPRDLTIPSRSQPSLNITSSSARDLTIPLAHLYLFFLTNRPSRPIVVVVAIVVAVAVAVVVVVVAVVVVAVVVAVVVVIVVMVVVVVVVVAVVVADAAKRPLASYHLRRSNHTPFHDRSTRRASLVTLPE